MDNMFHKSLFKLIKNLNWNSINWNLICDYIFIAHRLLNFIFLFKKHFNFNLYFLMIVYNHFENKVEFLNYKLFLVSEMNNERFIYLLQNAISKNLFFRIKAVEIIALKKSRNLKNKKFFEIGLKEKVYMALNLNFCFIITNYERFFFLKRNGLSLFFQVPFVYKNCFLALCNNLVLPVLDSKIGLISAGVLPFRNCHNILFEINNSLKRNKSIFWVLKIDLPFSILNTSWLLKNFPFNKRVLSLLCINHLNVFNLHKTFLFFSTLFDFLLKELV